MDNQQAALDSTSRVQTGNSVLALLFFATGALHLYGMMRSRPRRTVSAQKETIVFSSEIGLGVTVSFVAAMALIMRTLIF